MLPSTRKIRLLCICLVVAVIDVVDRTLADGPGIEILPAAFSDTNGPKYLIVGQAGNTAGGSSSNPSSVATTARPQNQQQNFAKQYRIGTERPTAIQQQIVYQQQQQQQQPVFQQQYVPQQQFAPQQQSFSQPQSVPQQRLVTQQQLASRQQTKYQELLTAYEQELAAYRQQPIYQQQQTVYQQPNYQQQQPVYQQQPVVNQPSAGTPLFGPVPSYTRPEYLQSISYQADPARPVYQQPTYQQYAAFPPQSVTPRPASRPSTASGFLEQIAEAFTLGITGSRSPSRPSSQARPFSGLSLPSLFRRLW